MISATKLPPELRANMTDAEILAVASLAESEIIRLRARVKDLEAALRIIDEAVEADYRNQTLCAATAECAQDIARKALEGVV